MKVVHVVVGIQCRLGRGVVFVKDTFLFAKQSTNLLGLTVKRQVMRHKSHGRLLHRLCKYVHAQCQQAAEQGYYNIGPSGFCG